MLPRCSVPLVGDLWNRGLQMHVLYCSTDTCILWPCRDTTAGPHTCISAIQLEPLKPCNPCTSFKFPPLPVTTNTLYSFFPLAVVQWNHLPSRAVVCSDRGTFRSVIIARQYSIAQTMKYFFLPSFNLFLTLVLLNKLRCHALYKFSANQITQSRLLI